LPLCYNFITSIVKSKVII